MLSFPVSPGLGQRFQGWTWDGVKWTPTKNDRAPKCGLLKLNGSSPSNALIFVPYKGDDIKINGLIYRIPAGGIVATYNNLYLEKVPGSTLAIGNTYFIYAFVVNNAVQLNFSANGHATSSTAGNVGTEIRSGDDTQTLVGVVVTGGSAPNIFYDSVLFRYLRSWFNRPRMVLSAATNGPGPAGAPQAVLGLGWMSFFDDSYVADCMWWGTSTVSGNIFASFRLNGVDTGGSFGCSTPHQTGAYRTSIGRTAGTPVDGYNNLNMMIRTDYGADPNGYYWNMATVAGPY
jgi:hypothetical protein